MMRSLLYGFIGVMLIATLPASALADREAPLSLLMRYLSPITSLQADFRQQTLDARQQSLQAFTGRLLLVREGPQLWWETYAPNEQILRVRDDTLWTLDIALEQLVIQPLGELWQQSPALLLTGSEHEITQRFEVELLENESISASFALIPRNPSDTLERIELRFFEGEPERIRLLDSFQQTTLLVFENRVLNVTIADDQFEFDTPTHFDVIDQRSP